MLKNGSECNVLLIQYCPIPRDVKANINKLEKMLDGYGDQDKIDIVVLPEMALTGYIFDHVEDVRPYLEEYNKGLTYEFCAKIALKYTYH
jgi:protein N-terminal amidase